MVKQIQIEQQTVTRSPVAAQSRSPVFRPASARPLAGGVKLEDGKDYDYLWKDIFIISERNANLKKKLFQLIGIQNERDFSFKNYQIETEDGSVLVKHQFWVATGERHRNGWPKGDFCYIVLDGENYKDMIKSSIVELEKDSIIFVNTSAHLSDSEIIREYQEKSGESRYSPPVISYRYLITNFDQVIVDQSADRLLPEDRPEGLKEIIMSKLWSVFWPGAYQD